ncbi:MAG: FecR domain-containing protein [Chitinispirillia bacterium]|nr:FecR domain-containing protein [Chitinispirillia bacterium]
MTNFRRQTLAGTVVLMILTAMPLFSQEERICTVKGIIGNVKVFSARDRRANADRNDVNTWPDLRLNMVLREKDVIITMPESEVRLEIVDGSIIKISENTTVEISTLRQRGSNTNTKINVVSGSIVTNVRKLADSRSSFEFETPTSAAAIRGTFVEVYVTDEGTTLKTFEGVVEAGPARSKNRVILEDYQMVEIAPKQKRVRAGEVPAKYKPRSTRLKNEEETAALTGYVRVMTQYSELEQLESALRGRGIPGAIGIGESPDELTARKIASDEARSALARAIETQVQRLSESYAQNVDGQTKKIWEETVRQTTDVEVRGATAFRTINQFNPRRNVYKTYTLMVLNPAVYKQAVTSSMQEELELKVKKDDMLKRLDTAVEEFNAAFER